MCTWIQQGTLSLRRAFCFNQLVLMASLLTALALLGCKSRADRWIAEVERDGGVIVCAASNRPLSDQVYLVDAVTGVTHVIHRAETSRSFPIASPRSAGPDLLIVRERNGIQRTMLWMSRNAREVAIAGLADGDIAQAAVNPGQPIVALAMRRSQDARTRLWHLGVCRA
jgi:hypothetical protein